MSLRRQATQSIWGNPEVPKTLSEVEQMKVGEESSIPLFRKALSLVTNGQNKGLMEAVQKKLSAAPKESASNILSAAIVVPSISEMKKLIQTSRKIVSLEVMQKITDVTDVLSLAKSETLFIRPKIRENSIQLPSFSMADWSHRLGSVYKVINYLAMTLAWSYSINIDKPPKNNWEAQGQISFLRSIISDSKWLKHIAYEYLETSWKVSLAALGVLGAAFAAYRLYNHFHIGVPELDKKNFRNLTLDAREGKLQKAIGRDEVTRTIITSLSPAPGQPPRMVFLVADPGVGKTQLMESFALTILTDAPNLKRKTVYSVNATVFLNPGTWDQDGYTSRIEMACNQLNGFEGDLILFIDEAHSLAVTNQQTGASLLEEMKTVFIQRKILCVFATTKKEYQTHIEQNDAFKERVKKIDLPPLERDDVLAVLERQPSTLIPERSAYEEIMKITAADPRYKDRADPRKSIQLLNDAMSEFYNWTPSKIALAIEDKTRKQINLQTFCQQKKTSVPGWVKSEEGAPKIEELRKLIEEIKELEKKKATQTAAHTYIVELRALLEEYTSQQEDIIRKLAAINESDSKSLEAEKDYLFLEYIVLPTLRKALKDAAEKFKADFKEEIPLAIDGEFIRRMNEGSTTSQKE
ncbi:MAG: AAA family ATPase [Chlamydiae bacterium]|nr:AAA family ATPase [Chlamydiota bacterium]